MEIGKKWREYMIAGVVCIGQICCMMILCWSSPVIPKLADPKQSPLGRPLTPEEISWIGSLPLLGGVLGPFLGSYLAGKLGRKGGTLTTCSLMMLGLLILTTGKHIVMIYLARFLGGFGFGLLFTITLLYVTEIASDEVRGALVSFLHIFGMLGTLSIFTVGPFLSYNHVNYFCIVCLLIFFVAFFFMPETPLFFLSRGNYPAASRSLEFIRGKTAVGVTYELTQLERDLQATTKAKGHLEDLWTTRSNLKAMFISFSLMILQQLAGIDIIIVYLMSVFAAARTDMRPEIASITVGAVQVLASCVTPLVVDRLGRKPLLMTSSLGMAICWGLFGMFFKLKDIESPWAEKLWFLPLLLLVLFMILYSTGFGPVPYVILGEVFPFNVKDFASALAVSLNWLVAFAMTKCFGGLVESLGMHNTFWIYGVLCIVAFLFTVIFVPETKGKSLQEIQDIMDKRRISKRMLKEQEQTLELMVIKSDSTA